MSARLRYVLLSAARTRTPLVPVAASIFAVLGVFAYRGNEVGEAWGLTAVLSCGLAAWLVGAVLAGEPQAQADMTTVALGGRSGRARLELVPIALAAGGLTVAFIAYPLLISPLGSTPMFVPAARSGDVAAAALGHVCCAIPGAEITACLTCIALAALALLLAARWARRTG